MPQHVIRTGDVVRWAKRPNRTHRVVHLYDAELWGDEQPIAAIEIIGEAWVRRRNVPVSELTLAPVDLEDLN